MFKKNLSIITMKKWLQNVTCSLGVVGISTLIGFPIVAQVYPPLYLFQPLASNNYPYRDGNSNLVDTIEEETNFANLASELKEAGLTETLSSEQYTIFAPTDDAFDALPDDVFDKFSQPENRLKVLQYHLVSGLVSEDDLAAGEIQTSTGSKISVSSENGFVMLNDAKAKHPSITATNGVIIEIDRVLLPPDF